MDRVKISDVCECKSSNLKQSDIENSVGTFPVYGASGFIKNVDFYEQEKESLAIVKDGAGVGRIFIVPAKSSILGTMQYLIPKQNILVKYLYYCLRNLNFQKYKTGATIPHIYFKSYCNEKVTTHDLPTQQKIVEELDCLSDIIEKKKKQLSDFDELVKSKFVEMFASYRQDRDFSDVLVDDTKRGCKFDSIYYQEKGDIPIIDQGEEFICGYKDKEIGKEPYKNESIVFGDHTERFKYLNFDYYLGADGAKILKCKEGFNTLFVYWFMKINYSAVGGYSRHFKFLKELLFSKPPIELQNEFAEFVKNIDKLKLDLKQSIEETQNLFNERMQHHFGE